MGGQDRGTLPSLRLDGIGPLPWLPSKRHGRGSSRGGAMASEPHSWREPRDMAAAVAVAAPWQRFLRGTWLAVCRSVSNGRPLSGLVAISLNGRPLSLQRETFYPSVSGPKSPRPRVPHSPRSLSPRPPQVGAPDCRGGGATAPQTTATAATTALLAAATAVAQVHPDHEG
jgi:hypothetical protein